MKSINVLVFGLFAAVLTLVGCEKSQAVEIGVGLNVGYRINESLVLEGQGTVNRSFDSSNYTGEVYTVGLTKTF